MVKLPSECSPTVGFQVVGSNRRIFIDHSSIPGIDAPRNAEENPAYDENMVGRIVGRRRARMLISAHEKTPSVNRGVVLFILVLTILTMKY